MKALENKMIKMNTVDLTVEPEPDVKILSYLRRRCKNTLEFFPKILFYRSELVMDYITVIMGTIVVFGDCKT